MANIHEVLTLEDRFSANLTRYITLGTQAALASSDMQASLLNIETATAATASAVDRLTDYLAEMDSQSRSATARADGLLSKLRSLLGAYAGLQGVKAIVGLSDAMAQTTARLDMMNDGLQTTAELNQMIYASAQRSRGSYQQTADMVAKLGNLAGDAFDSSAELVAFAEQLNKQIALSGASTQAADAAMLQLTQAMSSGTLRGEELNSILEQTPTIAQSIAEYMGVSTGVMCEMASEGAITAEVVKNAMFDAAEETNAKFEEMPMTWGQVWTSFQNTAVMAMQPVLGAINAAANNLDILIPIVATAGAAFAVFTLAANWTNICTAATNGLAAAQKVLAAVTATGWALPLMIVIAVVGAVYLLTAAYNKVTGATVSATGIIAGAFFAMGASIANQTIVPLQRGIAAFVNFIGNVFNDPVTAVKVLFYDMSLTVLGYIRSVVGGIEDLVNKIPGVQVSLTSGIDRLYNQMAANREAAIAAGSYQEFVKPMEYFDLSEAFQSGYNWGSNLNLLDFGGMGTSAASYGEIPTYDQMAELTDAAKGIEKSVNMSNEDLKLLIGNAERRYVSNVNLTSQTPVIHINGANTGNTAADRRAIADAVKTVLVEQLSSTAVRATAMPT